MCNGAGFRNCVQLVASLPLPLGLWKYAATRPFSDSCESAIAQQSSEIDYPTGPDN
jgi:hypothetical protein